MGVGTFSLVKEIPGLPSLFDPSLPIYIQGCTTIDIYSWSSSYDNTLSDIQLKISMLSVSLSLCTLTYIIVCGHTILVKATGAELSLENLYQLNLIVHNTLPCQLLSTILICINAVEPSSIYGLEAVQR